MDTILNKDNGLLELESGGWYCSLSS